MAKSRKMFTLKVSIAAVLGYGFGALANALQLTVHWYNFVVGPFLVLLVMEVATDTVLDIQREWKDILRTWRKTKAKIAQSREDAMRKIAENRERLRNDGKVH